MQAVVCEGDWLHCRHLWLRKLAHKACGSVGRELCICYIGVEEHCHFCIALSNSQNLQSQVLLANSAYDVPSCKEHASKAESQTRHGTSYLGHADAVAVHMTLKG